MNSEQWALYVPDVFKEAAKAFSENEGLWFLKSDGEMVEHKGAQTFQLEAGAKAAAGFREGDEVTLHASGLGHPLKLPRVETVEIRPETATEVKERMGYAASGLSKRDEEARLAYMAIRGREGAAPKAFEQESFPGELASLRRLVDKQFSELKEAKAKAIELERQAAVAKASSKHWADIADARLSQINTLNGQLNMAVDAATKLQLELDAIKDASARLSAPDENSKGAKLARAIGNFGKAHEASGNRRTQYIAD